MPLVEVHLLEGRSTEQKRRVLDAVTRAIKESTGSPLEGIRVWIHEMPRTDFMSGGVTAAERDRAGGDRADDDKTA